MISAVNHKEHEKPVIIMQPGPLHLFWTTGSFYFWELKDKFNFVFLVSDNYRQSVQFQKLAGLPSVLHVEYEPTKGLLALHRYYISKYAELLTSYQPHCVFLYNQSFPDNLYLTYLCKKIVNSATRYSFQLGWMPRRWRENFAATKAERIRGLSVRFPVFSQIPGLAKFVVDIRNYVNFFQNYKLLPSLVAGIFLNPPLNVYCGEVDADAMASWTDPQLVYTEKEMMGFYELGMTNLQLIKHPASTVGGDLFRFLYGDFIVQDDILILPTYGFTSGLLQSGRTEDEIIEHISECWSKALEALLLRFPDYGLKIKLHPAALKNDIIWVEIVKYLSWHFECLTVIPPEESAEWHIAKSKVVVGDVTSALWWAAMYGNKVVISFDIFGYHAGDDMSDVVGVHYVASVNDIADGCIMSISEKYQSQQCLSDIVN